MANVVKVQLKRKSHPLDECEALKCGMVSGNTNGGSICACGEDPQFCQRRKVLIRVSRKQGRALCTAA